MSDGYRSVRVIETEVYSRVVGYFRPVQNWNKGKQQEFSDRKVLRLKEGERDRNLRIYEEAGADASSGAVAVPATDPVTPVPSVRVQSGG